MSSCNDFRGRELERIVTHGVSAFAVDPQARCCAECDRWFGRQKLWLEGTAALERVHAPAALEERVFSTAPSESTAVSSDGAADGAPGDPRVVAALRVLDRVEAPAELEQRLFSAPAPAAVDESSEVRLSRTLRALPRVEAPAVLERLVSEELASTNASTRRFVGDLQRRETPPILWTRLMGRGAGTRWRVGAALAAGLLVFLFAGPLRHRYLGNPRLSDPQPQYSFDFEIVRVDSSNALDPMARALVAGLGGVDPNARGGPR